MRLVFDENAARDLENISDWISHDSPSAATNVIQRLKAACTNLPVFPAIGKESFEPGMRELVVTGLPYIIVYTVTVRVIRSLSLRSCTVPKTASQNRAANGRCVMLSFRIA